MKASCVSHRNESYEERRSVCVPSLKRGLCGLWYQRAHDVWEANEDKLCCPVERWVRIFFLNIVFGKQYLPSKTSICSKKTVTHSL